MISRHVVRIALIAAVAALVLIPAGLAAPGGGGKGAGGGGGKPGGEGDGSSSLSLVLLNSTDGQAHWGQQVTFNVSTTATTRPFVALSCSQGGALVYSMSAGFFAGYPFTTTFTLRSSKWVGGDASCTAKLYYSNSRGRTVDLGSLSFTAYA